MAKILDQYQQFYDNTHYDWFLSASKLNKYCYVPVLFEQRFCMSTDNSVETMLDVTFRSAQCGFEQMSFMYIVSSAKYELERHRSLILTGIVLAVIFTVFVLSKK